VPRPLFLFCGRHEGGRGDKQRLILTPVSSPASTLRPSAPTLTPHSMRLPQPLGEECRDLFRKYGWCRLEEEYLRLGSVKAGSGNIK